MTLYSSKSRLIFIFVALFATAQLSSSSPIGNDAQLVLTERVDTLQSKMDQLITQLEEEQLLRGHLQISNAELEKKLHQLSKDNTKQNELFEAKINTLLVQNAQQELEINQLKNKIEEGIADTIHPKASLNRDDKWANANEADYLKSDYSSPRLPPSSCRQLSTIGHYLDGIYLVANPDTKKIETVYCDFGSSTLSETLFGSVDVKSQSVHFYVQKNKDFSPNSTSVIPFDIERLNVGGAMNLATGVFTVPVDGIYHFEFSGLKDTDASTYLYIQLQVNGANIGSSFADNSNSYTRNGLSSINASLRLKTGDQVRLANGIGTLDDDDAHYTHFTGWLVEEDLQMLV